MTLAITGMTCGASCARRVRAALEAQPGVRHVRVDLIPARAVVFVQPDQYDRRLLLRALDRAGYQGRVVEEEPLAGVP